MALLILVVEDDPGTRTVIRDSLEFCGYSVIEAENVKQALSLLLQYHPHLLVSDIKMPGEENGYDLVKKIRQRPEFRLLPVVFLTQHRDTQARILGYQAGCDAYLPKPFETEELIAVIKSLLERAQMIQAELRYAAAEIPPATEQEKKELDITLTEREEQVLQLLIRGLSNSAIGKELHLSPRTIEKYVTNLLRKTDTTNRVELVRFALEHQLLS
ncbi:MAG: DNA-binding response regulator [Cyanobacteria bacterium J083]|nr:MAG: DNA-binding response regulator [Cyanobacteria bacterium J083]